MRRLRGPAGGRGLTEERVGRILRALEGLRVPAFPSETELHRMIAAALEGGGFDVRHEVALGGGRRIDFIVDGIGLEIKKGRPARARLFRQAEGYLRSGAIEALILIVGRNAELPATISGMPVAVFGLSKLWGVALP